MKTTLKTGLAVLGTMGLAPSMLSAEELSMLIVSNADSIAITEALTAAYTAANPDVTFDIEIRPGGSEGDNIVKTRLATGEMADIFEYNSGSLFQALRPGRTMLPLNDQPNMASLLDSYTSTVSDAEGNVYGVPIQFATGGGILYHRPTYEALGLEIPTTWEAFMGNNARIAEETDKSPVIQTYRDTWTSQILVLADFYNVLAEAPDFPASFTANEAKFATTPAATRSFGKLQDVAEAGYLNEDFGAASYNDGLEKLASGKGVHYPMLTVAIGAIEQNTPDLLEDVGIFAIPGDSAEANGLTVWIPNSFYAPATTEQPEATAAFLNWVASPAACDAMIEAVGAIGPSVVQGCTMPEDLLPVVADMMPYFEADNATAPALEFLSPVKGPALEQLTVEVGTGIRDAESAAALYDADVAKQAKQLGLPNW